MTQDKEDETGKGSEETKQDLVAKDENPDDSVKDKGDEPAKEHDDGEEKDLNELEEKAGEEFNQEEKVRDGSEREHVVCACNRTFSLNNDMYIIDCTRMRIYTGSINSSNSLEFGEFCSTWSLWQLIGYCLTNLHLVLCTNTC